MTPIFVLDPSNSKNISGHWYTKITEHLRHVLYLNSQYGNNVLFVRMHNCTVGCIKLRYVPYRHGSPSEAYNQITDSDV